MAAPRRVRELDFLVIGGGLGGLAGALAAHEAGLETLILEKTDLVGGVSSYSGGVVWVPANHLERAEGIDDSIEDAERYLDWVNGTQPKDEALRRAYLEAGPQIVEWLTEEIGIPFQIDGDIDHFYRVAPGSRQTGRTLEVALAGAELGAWADRVRPSPHMPLVGVTHREVNELGGDYQVLTVHAELLRQRRAEDFRTYGLGLTSGFVKAVLTERGVPIELTATTRELLQEDGAVVGAIAELGGELVELRARCGVLIATGSYGNADWAAAAEGLPEIVEASPPVLQGDGLRLTDPTPAALVRVGQAFTVPGIPSPGEVHPGTDVPLYREVFDSIGYPHSICVNDRGERFVDESYYGYFMPAVRWYDGNRKRWPNHPSFLIVDSRFQRQYMLGSVHLPGEPWAEEIPHADTLEELAAQLGIDATGLAATVARYNGFCADGVDLDFGRGSLEFARLYNGDPSYPNPNMGPLSQPPYWGLRLTLLGLGIYSMGLQIDGQARCLTRDGVPVPGLYATGNAVAYTEHPAYASGLGNGRNIVYATLAARHAATRKAPATTRAGGG